jgi:thymidylate kinase
MSKFIVFEGGDGSGKTSLSNLLVELLINDNQAVVKTCEPRDSVIGRMIRKYAKKGITGLPPKGELGMTLISGIGNLNIMGEIPLMTYGHIASADDIHRICDITDIDDIIMYHLLMADRYLHIKWILQQLNKGITVVCDRYIYSTMVYQHSMINKIMDDYTDILKPDVLIYCKNSDDNRMFQNRVEFDKFEKDVETVKSYNKLYEKVLADVSHPNMIVIETSGEIENTHSEFKLKMQELGLI